jgi:hypothetical protein
MKPQNLRRSTSPRELPGCMAKGSEKRQMKGRKKDIADLPVSFPEVVFKKRALDLKAMSFERWLRLGGVLGEIEDSVQFWIGDYLNSGERAYGEKYSQAVDQKQADRWKNYAWVSRSVEKSLRKDILSYKHHEVVARLKPLQQAKWLNDAIENKWAVHTLREKIALSGEPEPVIERRLPRDPPMIEPEPYQETDEEILPNQRPGLEREFKHLLDLCRALSVAHRGDLAKGIKPNEEDARRLWSALDYFVAEHDNRKRA